MRLQPQLNINDPRYQDWDCVSSAFFLDVFVPFSQVNDFVRDKFTTQDDTIALSAEILAGGCVSMALMFL